MKLRGLIAAILLVSVGLVGCGNDTDTTNNTTSPNNGADTQLEDAGDTADAPSDTDPQDGETDAPDNDAGDTDGGDEDADVDDGDTDVTPDTDTGEDNSCQEGDDADCDYDGLLDCEEQQLGTDSCDHDSDNDGLNDMQELLNNTDPLDPDSDGDGVEDGKEVDLGLNPDKESSFDDNIRDGDRWVVTACDDPAAESINFRIKNDANWRVALPPAFNTNYTELTIQGATNSNRRAAAMYDDPTNEVAGYLLSSKPNQTSPNDILNNYRSNAVNSLGSVDQMAIGGEFQTHDYQRAAIGRFLVSTSATKTVKEVREALFKSMAPYDNDVSGYPSTSGASYNEFRIFVSVIYREYDSGEKQVLSSVAIAPADKYDNRDRVKFRMDDLTNTTNIAEATAGDLLRCDLFEPKENTKADFYWVLDQSGSMGDDYNRVRAVANGFFNELNNTGLDYRLGVTPMDEDYFGRLRSGVGWHTDLGTFLGEIDDVENGGYDCCAEYGLKVAQAGIEFMMGISGNPGSHRIRPDAQLVTIWMADEEAQTIQNDGLGGATGQQKLNDFINFFTQHTIGFAIVGTGSGCGQDGQAYRLVAEATGGSHASLCAQDISETIEDIIFATTGSTGYELPDTPISSSLRVYINGEWVPRSRQNGFDYFAQNNAIAFFGDYRPEVPETETEAPDFISVSYETFLDRSK